MTDKMTKYSSAAVKGLKTKFPQTIIYHKVILAKPGWMHNKFIEYSIDAENNILNVWYN